MRKEVRFGDIVNNFDGKRVPLKSMDRSNMNKVYPYYGASGVIDKVENFLFDGSYLLISEDGANLLARSTPIAFIVSGKFWVNNHAHIVQAKKGISIDKYLEYYLNSIDLSIYITGSAQPKLNQKKLNSIQIPLPPLQQQQHIAAILDEADKVRQLNKKLIEKYNALTQSLFLEMFGDPVTNPMEWEVKILGNICGVGSSKRVFVDELVKSGIPFYRGTEIGQLSEDENIKPSLFITKEHYRQLVKHTGEPQIGDLLMPSICPDGRIYRVSNNNSFYFKDGRVLWIKVKSSNINSMYLRAFLKEIFCANYSSIASGTTFAELKIVALKKIKVLSPPLSKQNQFAEGIQEIEAQKSQAEKSLEKSEDLFNSLLQRAFKGELG